MNEQLHRTFSEGNINLCCAIRDVGLHGFCFIRVNGSTGYSNGDAKIELNILSQF